MISPELALEKLATINKIGLLLKGKEPYATIKEFEEFFEKRLATFPKKGNAGSSVEIYLRDDRPLLKKLDDMIKEGLGRLTVSIATIYPKLPGSTLRANLEKISQLTGLENSLLARKRYHLRLLIDGVSLAEMRQSLVSTDEGVESRRNSPKTTDLDAVSAYSETDMTGSDERRETTITQSLNDTTLTQPAVSQAAGLPRRGFFASLFCCVRQQPEVEEYVSTRAFETKV